MYALSGSAVAQLTPLVQRSGADNWNSAFGRAEKRWEILGGSLFPLLLEFTPESPTLAATDQEAAATNLNLLSYKLWH